MGVERTAVESARRDSVGLVLSAPRATRRPCSPVDAAVPDMGLPKCGFPGRPSVSGRRPNAVAATSPYKTHLLREERRSDEDGAGAAREALQKAPRGAPPAAVSLPLALLHPASVVPGFDEPESCADVRVRPAAGVWDAVRAAYRGRPPRRPCPSQTPNPPISPPEECSPSSSRRCARSAAWASSAPPNHRRPGTTALGASWKSEQQLQPARHRAA